MQPNNSPPQLHTGSKESWSLHEDKQLMKLSDVYLSNWKLISYTISSFDFIIKGHRTERECDVRLKKLKEPKVTEIVEIPAETKETSLVGDRNRKFDIFVDRFNTINKHITAKRKDSEKSNGKSIST